MARDSSVCPSCKGAKCAACAFEGSWRPDQWFTPPEIVEAAREALVWVDLDPFSCAEANGVVQAIRYYDELDDGFERGWFGRVFVNWPGQNARSAARLIDQLPYCERVVAVLFNADTSTGWFHDLLATSPDICFPTSRIQFRRPGGWVPGAGRHANAILGWNCPQFTYAFSGVGPSFRENVLLPSRRPDAIHELLDR